MRVICCVYILSVFSLDIFNFKKLKKTIDKDERARIQTSIEYVTKSTDCGKFQKFDSGGLSNAYISLIKVATHFFYFREKVVFLRFFLSDGKSNI